MIMKRVRRKIHQLQLRHGVTISTIETYLCLGHYVETQPLIDEAGSHFGEIALVRYKAATAKTARTAYFMEPFGPLGV